jgi:hypothetical protein
MTGGGLLTKMKSMLPGRSVSANLSLTNEQRSTGPQKHSKDSVHGARVNSSGYSKLLGRVVKSGYNYGLQSITGNTHYPARIFVEEPFRKGDTHSNDQVERMMGLPTKAEIYAQEQRQKKIDSKLNNIINKYRAEMKSGNFNPEQKATWWRTEYLDANAAGGYSGTREVKEFDDSKARLYRAALERYNKMKQENTALTTN